MLLEKIEHVNDIKKINKEDYGALAQEIRNFLIEKISVTGGHLGSNLGAVELTMALHLALNLPEDKIIWDVGHQSYTHKILTGRKEGFDGLRQFRGMSGFPKRKESICDAFDTGHSSTSISAGLDYPGIGPEHAYLHDIGRAQYIPVTDDEAVAAFEYLAKTEGIICAIESAHAVAYARKLVPTMKKDDVVIICLSGRGDKDVAAIARYRGVDLHE